MPDPLSPPDADADAPPQPVAIDPGPPGTGYEALEDPSPTGQIPPATAAPRAGSWMRRHRRWLIAGGAVVLAAGTGIGIWLSTSGTTSSGPGIHVKTAVVSVTTGTIKKTVAASGTIEPAQESSLNFSVSGTVTAVDVAAGQDVTAGETLASVSPTALEAQESADQAALTAAESKLSSDETASASTSQLASDKAAVTSAKDQLTTAQKAVADANLTSPIAGSVASIDLTVGEQVGGGSTGHGATGTSGSSSSSQVEVVSNDSFVVDCTLDDTEVAEVQDADQAVITPTGSTAPVYGTVASVGEIASGSSTVASFPVTVDVTGDPGGIYAGASANVSIVVKQLNDVVEVPSAAIAYSNGQATVTMVTDSRHVHQAVTTGTTTSSSNETQITKGLRAGQKIIEREVTFTGGGGTSPFGRAGGGGARFFGGGGAPSGGFGTKRLNTSVGGFGGG
jgi:membrane fusion protein, macrolide-specific efflux system